MRVQIATDYRNEPVTADYARIKMVETGSVTSEIFCKKVGNGINVEVYDNDGETLVSSNRNIDVMARKLALAEAIIHRLKVRSITRFANGGVNGELVNEAVNRLASFINHGGSIDSSDVKMICEAITAPKC